MVIEIGIREELTELPNFSSLKCKEKVECVQGHFVLLEPWKGVLASPCTASKADKEGHLLKLLLGVIFHTVHFGSC